MQWMNLSQRFFEVGGNGVLADFIPVFRHFPTKGVRVIKQLADEFLGKIEKEIKEHQARYDGGKSCLVYA